ncbi:AAA family ATPase [Xylophilus ampelinus]|uniref:Putative ATPase n=1 Tax=Xylophilus ampelinus TaxID=54067 RepID=A0A318SI24_9BURK|nr:ATP-binding protein [Xylophilus ampelinus]MCS4511563.1 AAA family ATPase [Xylophilus ampelinus]PYE74257.1 putative ATPase [Xylophilus ampelinus]
MSIRRFYIDNFKTLVDFHLPPLPHVLGAFTCLVGLNGAGKSSVLQAFDLLGHLATGDVEDWLRQREWEKSDLTSRFLKRQLINFELEFDLPSVGPVEWKGAFNTSLLRCTAESVRVDGGDVLRIGEDHLKVATGPWSPPLLYPLLGLDYHGSTLSFLKTEKLHPALHALREHATRLRSLDMLSPQSMRRRAKDGTHIGYGGERLSAFLHALPRHGQQQLLRSLQRFYPQLADWSTKALRAGWKDLRVSEQYPDANGKPLETAARHINDGLLRVLAVLSQFGSAAAADDAPVLSPPAPRACLLLDEIENGINPELMQRLVEALLEADRQIIITTHSPLVLNYLPDDFAREAVILLYRNPDGYTRSVRLFDLPSARERLRLLGPGEVFVDIPLRDVPAEAAALPVPPPP